MKTLIIIPTYNERENISKLLPRLLRIERSLEVLVVDDSSPDGTASRVREWAQRNERVHLIQRKKKRGLGSACVAGFKFSLAHGFGRAVTMDADFSHPPRYLPKFLEKLKSHDLVVGSRYVQGGAVTHWPRTRIAFSFLANGYARSVLGVSIRDLTGGFNGYRCGLLREMGLDQIVSEGYSFEIEMKYRAVKMGYRVTEFPILFTDRILGRSKISRKVIFQAALDVWRLRFSKQGRITPRPLSWARRRAIVRRRRR